MAAEKNIGTTLELVGTPNVAIADLTSIGEIGPSSDEVETTSLDSTGGYREFVPTLKDGGEVSLAGFVKSETNMEDMYALAEAQTIEDWIITTPSGTTVEFSGYVKMWRQAEITVDGVRGFTGSLRVTGPVTYTPAVVSA